MGLGKFFAADILLLTADFSFTVSDDQCIGRQGKDWMIYLHFYRYP